VTAGADAVLLGHLTVPRGNGAGQPKLPATLDPRAVTRARSLKPPPKALVLFADDVTMGALKPTLGGRRVGDLVPGTRGQMDPEDLPVELFADLARAGCDRWLSRGIPWRAFPLPDSWAGYQKGEVSGAEVPIERDSSGDDPEPVRARGGSSRLGGEQDPASYHRARQLLASRQDAPLWPDSLPGLLWLDATSGQRWGEAHDLATFLREHWRRVVQCRTGGRMPPGGPWRALLVTSHQSLANWPPLAELRRIRLEREGLCLVMGHPSLADCLGAHLPPEWQIIRIFDILPADLEPFLPEKGLFGP
jgi:hypothetical protein